ncbi:metallophosphoesterase [Clostridium akagii]|uniref:metallophosphoesterase n=1 Tax=Clostridium akagii TaxID=91623 RepID=UPI00047A6CC3|nr:metallophosphoesterase [Clostridium akagii]
MANILYILLYLFIFFTSWILIEGQVYKVRKTKIKNNKIKDNFDNFKIVFISDIHYGRFFRASRLISIVKMINKLDPSIIIIGGDYLDISVKSKSDVTKYLNKEFEILRRLRAQIGIFTVLGNHDYFNRRDSLLNEIKLSSFQILKNKKKVINIGKESIELIGVDDLVEGNPDVNILKKNSGSFTIAISHNPDFFSDYKNVINYDLGLAGHTHGGQVTFFGLYAPCTSSKYGQKYVKNIVHEVNRDILVTKGIGNGVLPIRFFASPEIVQINLKTGTSVKN